MVAKLLLSEKILAKFKADTLDGSEPELELPPLNIFDSGLSKEIASDKKDSLDLEKVMTNLKADEISYKSIADKILHQHIDSISPSLVSSSDVSYVPWINLALNIFHFVGFVYLFWKSKVFASAMAMTRTQAYELNPEMFATPTVIRPSAWYEQLVLDPHPQTISLTVVIILIVLMWMLKEVLLICMNRVRFSKNVAVFWPGCVYLDIAFQIAHSKEAITLYLGKATSLTDNYSNIQQNPVSTVTIHQVIKGLIYRVKVHQRNECLLRKDYSMWQVPNSTYAGYFTVRKIKQALNSPPTRYRILIGQNGIFRSPPVFSSNIEQMNPLGIHLLPETDRHIRQTNLRYANSEASDDGPNYKPNKHNKSAKSSNRVLETNTGPIVTNVHVGNDNKTAAYV